MSYHAAKKAGITGQLLSSHLHFAIIALQGAKQRTPRLANMFLELPAESVRRQKQDFTSIAKGCPLPPPRAETDFRFQISKT